MPRAVLNEEQAGKIKRLLGEGLSVREVADQMGVHYKLVDNIKCGKNWVRVAAEAQEDNE